MSPIFTFTKMLPVGDDFFTWTDRQTGWHDEANSHSSRQCKAPKTPFTSHPRNKDYVPRRRIHKEKVHALLTQTDRSERKMKFPKNG